ncbi:MAG: prolyl oligopeptidase family serine peptidase [Cyclobacteriaceae bacterium]
MMANNLSNTFVLKWLLTGWLVMCALSCSEKNDPAPQVDEDNLVTASATGSRSAAELKFLIQLSGRDIDPNLFQYDVDVYNIVYTTTYRDEEINASGLVILPKTGTPLPMLSFQHGTIVQQSQAPSVQSKSSEQVISYSALASMGFITVVPDMIGFGESKEIFHPYYIEEPTAVAVIDMLRAAATLAEEKQLEFNSRLFLAGYSQGGYATLATHKALEESPLENFELVASFPGAGGYDITSMQQYFFDLETYDDPYYMAYVGMSYQSYYDEADLLTDFFNEPYTGKIPSLFDGLKSAGDIDAQLSHNISELVKEDILNNLETNPKYEFLREKFEENSLINWQPTLPIFLYHGDADVTVPYQNSQVTYENLLNNGATTEGLKLINLPGKDHETAVEPYIVDVILKLQSLK